MTTRYSCSLTARLLRHVVVLVLLSMSQLPRLAAAAQPTKPKAAAARSERSSSAVRGKGRAGGETAGRKAARSPETVVAGPLPLSRVTRRSDGGRDGAIRSAPVVMVATPGGVTIVRVPVPPTVLRQRSSGASSAFFAIRSVGGSRLVNGQEGAMQPLPSLRDAVPVSIIVNRRLAAGRVEVATVEFTVDSVMIDVPVMVDVAHIGSVTIQVPDRDVIVPAGEWVVARLRLQNGGNGVERVSLQAVVPGGWRWQADSLHEIRAGAVLDATVRLWAPTNALPGLQYVKLLVRRGTDVIADGQLRAAVPPSVRSGAGLAITLSSIGVSSPSGTSEVGYGLSASGRITDSTDLTMRASLGSSTDAGASFALARAGFLTMPPLITIKHPRRSFSAGVLNAPLRDPAGAFLSGLGATGSAQRGRWIVGAFGGRPFGQSARGPLETSEGLLAGGSLDRLVPRGGSLGVQAVHLDDASMLGRVQSLTVHGSNLAVGGGMLSMSAAHRRLWDPLPSLAGGPPALAAVPRNAVGASANYTIQSASGSLDVRVLHSPGGGRAFARTGTEFAASGAQRLGSMFALSGSGWLQSDANPSIGDVRTTGWNASPTLTPWSWLTLALDGRGSAFDLASGNIAYHNSEQLGGLFADLRAGPLFARVSASMGTATRRTSVDSLTAAGSSGQRLEDQALFGINTGRGTLEVSWSRLAYRGVTLTFPQQQTLSVRVDRFRLFSIGGEPLLVGLDAQRLGASPGFDAPWTVHGELRLPITRSLGVTLAADRNPFILLGLGNTGARQLTYSVRLDQQVSVQARATARGRRRVVYIDDNANGVFDRGEEPVSGVAVHCGSSLTSTDDAGQFRCQGTGDVQLDARTLPLGVLPPAQEQLPIGDVALARVHPVSVHLGVARSDSARLPVSELEKASVLARDAAGTRWVARSAGAGEFVFDALPLGRYVIEFEQALMREPVTLAGGAPEIWVRRDGGMETIDVAIKPRPARVKTFGPAANSAPTSQSPASQAPTAARDVREQRLP